MTIHPGYIGIDVSKHWLDVFEPRSGESMRIANTAKALAALARRIAASGDIAVFEATGGYDRRLREALIDAGAPHTRVNPARARAFARAAGVLAKTDKVDARMLASLGQALGLVPDAQPEPDRERLADLVRRRDQLVDMRAQERARVSECLERSLKADIEAHIDWLDRRIERFDVEIAALCKQSDAIASEVKILLSAPGVGPVNSAVFASLLPELGARSPKTIAALAGLAPLNVDSGQKRGQRRIAGGRRRVREALYMAAVSAIRGKNRFAAFYRRLRAAGKSAKLALIAVARKILIALNAMVRDNVPYAA